MQAKPVSLLEDKVINQIAAGEVVERPVSIVRELVDNSVDAGSSSIEVEINEGGQSLIRVRDNGTGMSSVDAELCFRRHATSKISKVEDLQDISSLGFRGEALSSIAAVSKVVLKTKSSSSEMGTELTLEEGKTISTKAWNGSIGSEFEVSRLFANLPARKKFLKSPRSDNAKIVEWLYASALGHPNVRYKLISSGVELIFLPAHKDIFERLSAIISGTTIRVDYSAGPFSIKGIVAHPAQAKSKLSNLVFLVNSRPVVDKLLMRALKDAWSTGLRGSETPIGALEITLPSTEVDINVHPQKSEVRFRNSQAMFGFLYKAIKFALSEWQPISQDLSSAFDSTIRTATELSAPAQIPVISEQIPLYANSSSREVFESVRFLGQVLGAFLIFEKDSRVFLLDAHAAHERVRFNELCRWAEAKENSSQNLLFPEKISLDESQLATLVERKGELNEIGFDFNESDSSLLVKQYPSALKISEIKWFFEMYSDSSGDNLRSSLKKLIEIDLARRACRSSVMSGNMLSSLEAISLWQKIQTEAHGAVCPHGRPVMVELTREQLDKMFLRDGFANLR
jgi:DNA mismatch repair protein MutL